MPTIEDQMNEQATGLTNGVDYHAQARAGEAAQLLMLVQQLQNLVVFSVLSAEFPAPAKEVAADKLERIVALLRQPQ